MASDPKLDAFVAAQDPVYDEVRRELAAGRKETHWIWFIFPQLAGLGSSAMSRRSRRSRRCSRSSSREKRTS